MNFERANEYLESFVSYEALKSVSYNERNFDLERVRRFLRDFGVDYSGVRFVHVGGSKGKGSTATLIAEYLFENSSRVGLFTSPHILNVTERIWLDGANISKERFAEAVMDLKAQIDSVGGCELTYFELLTVLALRIFVDSGVEYAVLEVGLGGRLDATNIVVPELCVLTLVELEHTEYLGNTIEKVLNEKLGIVKDGVPLLVGYQSDEVGKLIRKKLRGKEDLFFVEDFKDLDFRGSNSQGLNLQNSSLTLQRLNLRNQNLAQIKNGETAFAALKLLLGNVNKTLFLDVFKKFKMLGRFDVREIDGKTVVFDMAHTVASIENLIESLKYSFPDKKFVFLVSLMKGKDVSTILRKIGNVAERVIFTSSHKERGYKGQELAEILKGEAVEDCGFAFAEALKKLDECQILVVCGSHFLLSSLI